MRGRTVRPVVRIGKERSHGRIMMGRRPRTPARRSDRCSSPPTPSRRPPPFKARASGTSVLRLTAQEGERSHKVIRDGLRHMADLILILWRVLVNLDVLEQCPADYLVHRNPMMVCAHCEISTGRLYADSSTGSEWPARRRSRPARCSWVTTASVRRHRSRPARAAPMRSPGGVPGALGLAAAGSDDGSHECGGTKAQEDSIGQSLVAGDSRRTKYGGHSQRSQHNHGERTRWHSVRRRR